MAGSSLLLLIDDIATLLDDVSTMTKVATQKTAGVLGDDLALNAQQVAGVRAERELPVVWAVAKGSVRNKVILVPLALAASVLLPWLITPLLMLGGLYLCYEGVEKLAHKYLDHGADAAEHAARLQVLANPDIDMAAFERDKIKGAVRTDFILSAEIIVIALGVVAAAPFGQQVMALVLVAALMTVGVYGLVAAIVKLDDFGLWLLSAGKDDAALRAATGRGILWLAPRLMKTLSVLGTAAMFLVGGGILAHGTPPVAELEHAVAHAAEGLPVAGGLLATLAGPLTGALYGVLAGALTLLAVQGLSRKLNKNSKL